MIRHSQLTHLTPLLDEGLKIIELAINRNRREAVWSHAVKMRWLDNTGIDMFASMFFMTVGADYVYRYGNGC
jgi:hypothetical protein